MQKKIICLQTSYRNCVELFIYFIDAEAAIRVVLQEKVFLEISKNSQENTCAGLACNLIKTETLAQVF